MLYNFPYPDDLGGLVFDQLDGFAPAGTLLADGQGSFYGTTSVGGINGCDDSNNILGCGTVFKLSPQPNGSYAETMRYEFGAYSYDPNADYFIPEAFQPTGNLVLDAHGKLYGTTTYGGVGGCYAQIGIGDIGCGAVFELVRAGGSWTGKILYNFGASAADGTYPQAGLAIDAAGNLYGTTSSGGSSSSGTVFELIQENGNWVEKVLHNFNPSQAEGDGAAPLANLILDNEGNLYGTTSQGGTSNGGTAFILTPAEGGVWTEKVFSLYTTDASGYAPQAGLTMDATGTLYGTTSEGVFKLVSQADGSRIKTVLHTFPASQNDGDDPQGGVIFDNRGNLYGTTYGGGGAYDGDGTVYEIAGAGPATPLGTTTSLVVTPATSLVAGEPITLTATITPLSGPAIPAGTVSFVDPAGGGVTVPVIAGTATFYGKVPPVGTYSIFASYSGGSGFAASKSATDTKTVTASTK